MNSLRNSLVTLTLDIITRIKGKSHVHSSHLNCSVNFSRRLKSKNHLVQDNKQYHRKVLLSSFHLNGHTLGFHPQTQNYNRLYSIINSTTEEYNLVAFVYECSHCSISFPDSKVKTTWYNIINSKTQESTFQ